MEYKNVLYFNSTRTNTVAILDAFNGVKHWVQDDEGEDVEKTIPITFGNYEKSIAMDDIDPDLLNSGNFNHIPRMVLSFNSMTKASDRTTNKYNKISRRIKTEDQKVLVQFGYNSVPYDFQYTLMIQARGLNQAFMITEQIIQKFRPSYNIKVKEYPLFKEMTETQLQMEDPVFEIIEDFEDTDVNIVNVTIELNLKSNLYMPLQLIGRIETVKLFNQLWDNQDYRDSQLASKYEYDVCVHDYKIFNEALSEHIAPHKLVVEPVEENTSTVCDPITHTVINSEDNKTLISNNETLITQKPRD